MEPLVIWDLTTQTVDSHINLSWCWQCMITSYCNVSFTHHSNKTECPNMTSISKHPHIPHSLQTELKAVRICHWRIGFQRSYVLNWCIVVQCIGIALQEPGARLVPWPAWQTSWPVSSLRVTRGHGNLAWVDLGNLSGPCVKCTDHRHPINSGHCTLDCISVLFFFSGIHKFSFLSYY